METPLGTNLVTSVANEGRYKASSATHGVPDVALLFWGWDAGADLALADGNK